MSEIVKKWLKHQIDPMVSVQTSVIGNNPSLIIHTWTGARIHLYLIEAPIKPRTLKRILQEATNTGTNSMFILNVSLLPPDSQRVVPPEWLLAIQHLTNDRIYGYQITKQGIELIQVHFEPVNNNIEEYKTWYGPKIPFEKLRHYRVSVKPRYIKGDWLVADFDTPAYWRTNDYRHQHNQKDRQARQSGHTTWYTYSAQQTWSGYDDHGQSVHSPLQAYLHNCYQVLGIETSASRDEVKAAFRRRAIAYHPDTSELPREEAAAKFRELNDAYDYIKSANGWG